MAFRIAVVHGPNLNMLGVREPEMYGNTTLDDINAQLEERALKLQMELSITQKNSEGDIIDVLHNAAPWADGIVINPAAYTHTSVAIRDALAAVALPTIEVHISNVFAREPFRHKSLIAPVATGSIIGLGPQGYTLALDALYNLLHKRTS